MATTYTPVLVGKIDIGETYKQLMLLSTGQDSVYIKAKETITDSLGAMSGLSETDRAKIIGETISSIAKGITSEAMQMALKIETENRDAVYALTKLKADTMLVNANIAKTEKDIEMADKNLWIGTVTGWKAQAEIYRDYGVDVSSVLDTTKVLPAISYIDYGTKVETIKKAKVDTYATYANSYRQNGKVNYTVNPDGSFDVITGTQDGLTYWQTRVAERQKQGFDDNMRQHVVNSSASMISMLLSTEASGIDYSPYLTKWSTAASYLSTNLLVSAGTMAVSSWGTFSKSAGHVVVGSVTNINAGRGVMIKYIAPSVTVGSVTTQGSTIYGSANIVLMDGTFTITTPDTMLYSLVVGTLYTVRVETVDNAGNIVYVENHITALA